MNSNRSNRIRRCLAVVLVALLLPIGWTSAATSGADDQGAGPVDPVTEAFQPFATLLERYVIVADLLGGGWVSAFDYPAALASDDLDELLSDQDARLAAFDPAHLDRREAALAFWINAYNYFMVAHVLREAADSGELVDSVKDFGSFFRPYAVFGRELFVVGGRRYSLDGIEKGTLFGPEFRDKGWFDPRVHFAVNCASVGCPPLRPELYRPARVDAQLDDGTRRSLATPLHLEVDEGRIRWTRLFDWYEDDFTVGDASPRDFVMRHVDADRADAIRDASRIGFIDYDWRLNRPEHFDRLADRSTAE